MSPDEKGRALAGALAGLAAGMLLGAAGPVASGFFLAVAGAFAFVVLGGK